MTTLDDLLTQTLTVSANLIAIERNSGTRSPG